MAGLRRNEIDKLEWTSFRWKDLTIRIEVTRVFQMKSEDSAGDVEVDLEFMELFRGYHANSKGDFVIASSNLPRPGATYSHYRCEREFSTLIDWLRTHGVTGARPLHSLRKEYGSQICARYGIYAASHALRHADIIQSHLSTTSTRRDERRLVWDIFCNHGMSSRKTRRSSRGSDKQVNCLGALIFRILKHYLPS